MHRLPKVGEVIVRRAGSELLIVDRGTGGRRFFLSGLAAGECLSFIKANPSAAATSLAAACPNTIEHAPASGSSSGTSE
jgi:hypothetical protein